MAKGICELVFGSRPEAVDGCTRPASGPKKEEPPPPGGTVEVGDGKTSVSRDGTSLRSFHIPVPQEKVDAPELRPMTEDVECDPQGTLPLSADGVLGCDPVGDIELLANEPLRGRGRGCEVVSLSQEDRRTGLGG